LHKLLYVTNKIQIECHNQLVWAGLLGATIREHITIDLSLMCT